MQYKRTTQVPNTLFDELLPLLSLAELKVLLVIIRQTNGWLDKKTGKRKVRDRISHSQFIAKTGLSRRRVSSAIQDLINIHLIRVTSYIGEELLIPKERKGKQYLYYSSIIELAQSSASTSAHFADVPMQKRTHNKTKNHDETKNIKYRDEIREVITSLKRTLNVDR